MQELLRSIPAKKRVVLIAWLARLTVYSDVLLPFEKAPRRHGSFLVWVRSAREIAHCVQQNPLYSCAACGLPSPSRVAAKSIRGGLDHEYRWANAA
jgi:hypothetical protein